MEIYLPRIGLTYHNLNGSVACKKNNSLKKRYFQTVLEMRFFTEKQGKGWGWGFSADGYVGFHTLC